ncbi:MAG TPA: PIG-L deacetylase family protein [Saprospiraceae bacterium]|nr:PIG-L deacetylase family protein [Saprospiraceae bacterium]
MNIYNLQHKKVLVLAPHTDDGELGCGATIARFIEEGAEVYYAAFSTADESVPKEFPPNQLEIEVKDATGILGILPDKLIVFNYQVRKLNYIRQEILDLLIKMRDDIKPDLVLLPSSKDFHQDHQTVTQEAIRAFKFCSILGYELIWNNLSFNTDCFITLTEDQLNKKIKALSAYKTQAQKNFMSPEFIRSLAIVRGTQIGTAYAESFEVIRWIL